MTARTMRKIPPILLALVVAVAAFVVTAGAWLVWELHPWVPAGQAHFLGNWQFGDCEFQVWQRKNPDAFEPFADGLFVRHGDHPWRAFCFDIQDSYSPRVSLRQRQNEIIIDCGGENRGVYDMTARTFRRGGPAITPTMVTGDPPGDWWLKP